MQFKNNWNSNGQRKAVEIAKQLFDLNMLFDRVTSYQQVGLSLKKLRRCALNIIKEILPLSRSTMTLLKQGNPMAMMGKHDAELYNEIKNGVSALSQYLNRKNNLWIQQSTDCCCENCIHGRVFNERN
ncbi:MAG: hypothetical protein IPL12_06120 [Bacteroidetes bacterium]|nr:hypothetical protein [Bacteroidota bacterium]